MKKHHFVFLLIMLGITLFSLSCKKHEPETTKEPTPTNTSPIKNEDVALEGGKIQLMIFYAGHPGTKREKDFVNFLNKHFAKVEIGDLATYNGSQSKGFDVTILDYDGDGFKSPRPQLSRDFSKPVITMGVTGAFICGNLNLKTNYL